MERCWSRATLTLSVVLLGHHWRATVMSEAQRCLCTTWPDCVKLSGRGDGLTPDAAGGARRTMRRHLQEETAGRQQVSSADRLRPGRCLFVALPEPGGGAGRQQHLVLCSEEVPHPDPASSCFLANQDRVMLRRCRLCCRDTIRTKTVSFESTDVICGYVPYVSAGQTQN